MIVPESVELRYEDHHSLAEYATVPVAYEVRVVMQSPAAGARPPLPQGTANRSYWKDYDAIPGNHPRDWPARFAVDRARFVAAYMDGRRVGGAVVILDPTDIERLGGESGLALLWDLRVDPEFRGRGFGRALLMSAEGLARRAGVGGIIAETQDTNFPACQLYASSGYTLARIEPDAYPTLPEETLLVWRNTFLPTG
jgi:ribosomal protein S18 acetylase RimI-like enzyme